MNEKLKYKIRIVVGKLGVKQSLDMFGKDIIKQVYIDNPSLFLIQFNNLNPIEEDDEIYYVDNDKHPLFHYNKEDQELKNGYYWINYDRVWLFFSSVMGYEGAETQQIIKEWLGTTYNLRELTPIKIYLSANSKVGDDL